MTPSVSVIIPALDEERSIAAALDAAARAGDGVELIVVDGGSTDRTREVARGLGALVISAGRGRGSQMHAGALAARGGALWFVHADTLVPAGGARLVTEALADAGVAGGNFRVRFDGETRPARFLSWLYPRLRLLGLCYGDSALFARREAYFAAGGFKPFPVFEDLDLLRALRRRGRVVEVPGWVVTSSRRFEGRSFAMTFARWSALQLLYWLGVSPHTLGRWYAHVRAPGRRGRRRPEQG
ncbi:MAG TPA: TIGR04283 family arsenosugar biosynthesis glycosyltransferase [Pyrinomonadaceae bacterium]|nr:TIGR04283 family arsenosugar biosynthesis glycosyltransferase [Pyrinomonadaceae bacterium]